MIDKRIYSPDWPDLNAYKQVIKKINQYPSLVYPDEIIRLKNNLKPVSYTHLTLPTILLV